MKLHDAWKHYQEYTETFSREARKAAVALGAGCWFFRAEDMTFPPLVYLCLIAVVMFFSVDLMQMLWASLRQKAWLEEEEKDLRSQGEDTGDNPDIRKPESVDKPIFILYLAKALAIVVAAAFLLVQFALPLVSTGIRVLRSYL